MSYGVLNLSRAIDNPKQLILSKAEEILYNEGYQKLSMRNISKACDIALGTIYNYYPTKKELIVDMMTGYWHEYFFKVQSIANLDCSFYEKLYEVFNILNTFIKNFKAIWLKPELYENPDYIESGIEKENIYIERLITFIENILIKEINENKVQCKLNPHEAAKFILMNFITIIQTPIFKYSSFELILKELII